MKSSLMSSDKAYSDVFSTNIKLHLSCKFLLTACLIVATIVNEWNLSCSRCFCLLCPDVLKQLDSVNILLSGVGKL